MDFGTLKDGTLETVLGHIFSRVTGKTREAAGKADIIILIPYYNIYLINLTLSMPYH